MKSTEAGALRVLMAGGGTGGHVIPALAIARELRDQHGAQVRFVGTVRGLETKLVPDAGFSLELVQVGMLKGVSLATRMRTVMDLPRAVLRCIGLLRNFRPNVVVGVGGYASGPAMLAAVLLRVPTLAFEPNAVPGLANRLVGRFVSAAAVNFEETRRYFRRARVTGIPVRAEFFAIQPKPAGTSKRLLIFGGSQGARMLNEIMPQIAEMLFEQIPNLEIVHQAGGRQGNTCAEAYAQKNLPVRVQPYLENMPGEFAAADLLLCRSGASTMAELAAAGKPSVLVPFPGAADDHQRKNAEVFVRAGAAVMMIQAEMSPESLSSVLLSLLKDEGRRIAMGAAARRLSQSEAVKEIAALVLELGRNY